MNNIRNNPQHSTETHDSVVLSRDLILAGAYCTLSENPSRKSIFKQPDRETQQIRAKLKEILTIANKRGANFILDGVEELRGPKSVVNALIQNNEI